MCYNALSYRRLLKNCIPVCICRYHHIKYLSEKLTNEQVLEHVAEKRTLLNNIIRRKVNWIDHILKSNCLRRDVIEG